MYTCCGAPFPSKLHPGLHPGHLEALDHRLGEFRVQGVRGLLELLQGLRCENTLDHKSLWDYIGLYRDYRDPNNGESNG